ncbi:MAG: hypothetical protein K8H90_07300, partial [Thermoanaerobaculia bacterium]|nr:hypothetical protein [Thermoanaerobaculia bacterium]
ASVGDCETPAIWALGRTSGTVTQLFGPERRDRPPLAAVLGSASGQALIAASSFESGRRELWRSDGTEAGTTKLLELEAGWREGWPRDVSLGGESWALLRRPDGLGAWFAMREDGALDRVSPWQSYWTDLGGTETYRIQVAQPELGVTADLVYALRSSAEAAEVLGDRYVTRGVSLGERWFGLLGAVSGVDAALITDGTASGTSELLPCPDGWSTQDTALAALDGRALYVCRPEDGTVLALQVWAGDGTPAGTLRLAVADQGTLPSHYAEWQVAGSRAFLVGFVQREDGSRDFTSRRVWITDGTPAGTRSLGAFARGEELDLFGAALATPAGLLLRTFDAGHGRELWYLDAATATPRLLADLRPGPGSSDPRLLGMTGSKVYFTADDGLHGRELWVWDMASAAACRESERALCLQQGRFRVEAFWQDFEGEFGEATAVPLTPDSGSFWFFDEANVELVTKVLDGTGTNGHFWHFFGALSNVSYAVTVTDGTTGAARRYENPPGRYASVGDTIAFGPLGASVSSAPIPSEPVAAGGGGTTWLAASESS